MKLSQKDFKRICDWIHRNGRAIEVSLCNFHFEHGTANAVADALSYYQNDDGGFGNALEPDVWNPHSTPYATSIAINMLHSIGFKELSHPLLQGIVRYLASGNSFENGQWLFTVPTNDQYPCAPWWNYNPEANAYESAGLSAVLATFALDAFKPGTETHDRAKAISDRMYDLLMAPDQKGEMLLGGYFALLNQWAASGRSIPQIIARLHELVNAAIDRDPSHWEGYVKRPSTMIFSPQSPFYEENRSIVETELDYLVDTLPTNDVWGINWSWFDNGEKYQKAFAISENWWKASKAIDNLLWLKAFSWIA